MYQHDVVTIQRKSIMIKSVPFLNIIMSTMQSKSLTKKAGSPKDDGEDDVGALIYREVQLRKAEAAAAAANESKKTSSASAHRRTSTRKRSPVISRNKSLPSSKYNGTSKRKRKSTSEKDLSGKIVEKKKYRYECSAVDAQIMPRLEDCAFVMEQRPNDAAVKDAQTKPSVEEFVGDTGQRRIATYKMNRIKAS